MKRPFVHIGITLLVLAVAPCGAASERLAPSSALERSGFWRLTSSREASEFLHRLDELSSRVRVELIGRSAGGRPLEAVWISQAFDRKVREERLRILLVGTQHGTEPSGGEALLLLARAMTNGRLLGMLDHAEFIVVPNANPDGRDLRRRVNAAGVNLSTDFLLLSQPESRALNDLLIRTRPDVVLDVHESAILKKKSLGSQGYLTDFEAQFEIANNPNVYEAIRDLSLTHLLPEVIALVERRGLRAQRYIGEITSVEQPITNGGLSAKNLRNKAGLLNSFSFLLENRLDPPAPSYSSLRNIRTRVAKQVLSITAFLEVIVRHAHEVQRVTREARARTSRRSVVLQVDYRLDSKHPRIAIPLRSRNSGRLVEHWFPDHRAVATCQSISLPRAYVLRSRVDRILPLLRRHRLRYRSPSRDMIVEATAQRSTTGQFARREDCQAPLQNGKPIELKVRASDLWIDVEPSLGVLIPILLEPRSTSSVLTQPAYGRSSRQGSDDLIYRVERASWCARASD